MLRANPTHPTTHPTTIRMGRRGMKMRIVNKMKKSSRGISINKIKSKQMIHNRKRVKHTVLMEWLDRGPQVNLQNNAQHWKGQKTET